MGRTDRDLRLADSGPSRSQSGGCGKASSGFDQTATVGPSHQPRPDDRRQRRHHWWAKGASNKPIKSASALGLVATATPVGIVIDPGGEEPDLTCPWTTTEEQATENCTMAYTKSSIDGTATYKDQPAFAVTMRGQWKLTFALHGTPVTFANVPDTTTGPPTTMTLAVAEIQSLVGPQQ